MSTANAFTTREANGNATRLLASAMLKYHTMKTPTPPKPTDWLGLEVCLELALGGLLILMVLRWLT